MTGRSEVGRYFYNYDRIEDWHLVAGLVDWRSALLVHDADNLSGAPAYFIFLRWAGDRLTNIRDFRYARYMTEGAEVVIPS